MSTRLFDLIGCLGIICPKNVRCPLSTTKSEKQRIIFIDQFVSLSFSSTFIMVNCSSSFLKTMTHLCDHFRKIQNQKNISRAIVVQLHLLVLLLMQNNQVEFTFVSLENVFLFLIVSFGQFGFVSFSLAIQTTSSCISFCWS